MQYFPHWIDGETEAVSLEEVDLSPKSTAGSQSSAWTIGACVMGTVVTSSLMSYSKGAWTLISEGGCSTVFSEKVKNYLKRK